MTNTQRDVATARRHLTSVLKHDLPASLVVFLVAMPLSLGIAIACGAPLVAALVAAVAGGILAGALGGSAVQVSGPAAGMTLVLAELIHTYGWRATCLITLMAGALQFLLGVFKVARAALAVSPAVVHGMLAGVGVTIALAQLHVVLGGAPQRGALENLAELPGQIATLHGDGTMTGLLVMAVLLVWNRLPRPARTLPGPLVALVVAAGVAAVFGWRVTHLDLAGSMDSWVGPALPDADWHGVAAAVLLVALLASVESLLSAIGIDRLHDGPRADLDRELTGQGVANMVSGVLGGLPVAGGIMRSTAGVRAGARTRWTAVLNGVWVLVFAVFLSWTVQLIPVEALAALLVFIGVQMVNLGHISHLRGHGEVPVYAVTFFGVVLIGLAEGVLIGLGLAALLALRRLTWVTVRTTSEPDGRYHIVVAGSLTFLGVPRLTAALRTIPQGAAVDLELNIDFMDNAAFEAIHTWRLEHERFGGTLTIDEIHDEWYALAASGARMFPAKTPPRAPDRWWLPWAYRRSRRMPQEHPEPAVPHPVPAVPVTSAVSAESPAAAANPTPPPNPTTHAPPGGATATVTAPAPASPHEWGHPTQDQAHPAHDQAHPGHDQAHAGHDQGHPTHGQAHPGHDPGHPTHGQAHAGHDPGHPTHGQAHPGHDRAHPATERAHVTVGRSGRSIPDLLAGTGEFHRHTAPLIRPILTRMARKQEPSHLFITCADSRIVPSLITASGPGDLFTVRNLGNLVPRKGSVPTDDSVAAAIEYATTILGVRTITVCGHSGCVAMATLLSAGVQAEEMPSVRRWLRHGGHTLARFIGSEGHGDDTGPLDRLCRVNVIQQLANLHTYPEVDRLVAKGRLELVGLYFDIPAARVHVLDRERFSRTAARDHQIC
ncbi:MFS superfamily sulfate permease-like transporter/carbonic anhydrase [Thermocatellispora tengchongensis]|uniref:carbonic anhydrase n=1 Tax=Thermocatellispora tengchongensis TaxID=1073253 RepID=A0A840PBX2_9ACTN|nr:SulP family inorganic anion transporter [Thermocatellispora tengchongensis]MBB5135341.1 MFS superfamily sulfate permease-like transporter/carbonic anhydrase [Thermocatellispora tengchongensis]